MRTGIYTIEIEGLKGNLEPTKINLTAELNAKLISFIDRLMEESEKYEPELNIKLTKENMNLEEAPDIQSARLKPTTAHQKSIDDLIADILKNKVM